MKRSKKILPPLIVLVIIIGLLELVTRVGGIDPTILPPPTQCFMALFTHMQDLAPHILNTVVSILIAFAIGVPLGLITAALFSQFGLINKMLTPYVIVLSCTPLLTLIPIFRVMLGFDNWVKVLVIIIQIVPIITLNSITGFNSVKREKRELMEAYGATKWESFWKVVFPNALPFIFTGVKLGCIFATIATISCEMNGFSVGLGTRVGYYSNYLLTDTVFAVIILIAIIGIILFEIVSFAESKIVTWKND